MRSSARGDRSWVVRGEVPTALLVPRVDPAPTREDVEAAYARGVEDGKRAAAAEQAHAVIALQEAAQAAQRALAEHLDRTRATTISLSVDLATELARWLVDHAIEVDPELLRRRIDLALDAIADERQARFVVAPCMVDLVQGWLGADTSVDGDPALAPGELRIDAGHADLDATYDVALGRAREALVQSFAHFDLREPV
jgi:flagellar biosynthesis/type III secretory pathway protein FliH